MQITECRLRSTECRVQLATEYIVQSKYQDMVQIPEYRVQRTGVQSTEHRVHSAPHRLQRREICTEYKVQQTDCGVQSTRTSTEHPGKQTCSSWTSGAFYVLDSRDLLEVLGDFLGRERGGGHQGILPDPMGILPRGSLSAKEVI